MTANTRKGLMLKCEMSNILFFSQLALYLTKVEYKPRLGIKNEHVHFVLLSTCIIFAPLIY